MRGLLLSDRFRRGYVECNSNTRLAELVGGRLLGRPIHNQSEAIALSIKIAVAGFASFVDEILESKEYMEYADYTFEEHFKGKNVPSYMPRAVIREYLIGRYTYKK